MRALKKPTPVRPDCLHRGGVYRYCPPSGSPHPESCLVGYAGRPCMLLQCNDGTFAAVTFSDGAVAWISSDYLRVDG